MALSSASLVVGATGCGGDRVDRRDLESKVSDFILKQTGTTASVRCPNDIDPDKGHKTTCVADLSGTPTNLEIVFTSKGRFQVHVDPSKLG
jgi:Domain of unknown function (DUF4333)